MSHTDTPDLPGTKPCRSEPDKKGRGDIDLGCRRHGPAGSWSSHRRGESSCRPAGRRDACRVDAVLARGEDAHCATVEASLGAVVIRLAPSPLAPIQQAARLSAGTYAGSVQLRHAGAGTGEHPAGGDGRRTCQQRGGHHLRLDLRRPAKDRHQGEHAMSLREMSDRVGDSSGRRVAGRCRGIVSGTPSTSSPPTTHQDSPTVSTCRMRTSRASTSSRGLGGGAAQNWVIDATGLECARFLPGLGDVMLATHAG